MVLLHKHRYSTHRRRQEDLDFLDEGQHRLHILLHSGVRNDGIALKYGSEESIERACVWVCFVSDVPAGSWRRRRRSRELNENEQARRAEQKTHEGRRTGPPVLQLLLHARQVEHVCPSIRYYCSCTHSPSQSYSHRYRDR
jgi:hypothetical protein